ncbi:MAG: multifunctional CCA tRNA nucleotidyl transferase/2'3'-cyclic phosphodiesterase/2'nucleotidase/phosphatase [Candidatus Protistobacter heckmanni]|nr:multifunctional CCA tRNA nucleotidyl transferase/2'3'-cyclic phosphodiesterase/2'nucleotidase/phosphatase [Candidatus Protistobacter heckmanni]
MQIYIVGGAIRDALLGLPVVDRDYVVVGATPEDMAALGYHPVGADFPVFLHPKTHEEYALARSERKTAPGYKGFVFHAGPEVTLEQDLLRRDLTVNAMARALGPDGKETGPLIDPHGGRSDLDARVFRHVSPAFGEDPVRILRLARFAARFPEFRVAPDTLALMRGMVASGEVDALVPERAWQEIARGLAAGRPSRMLQELATCGALPRILPCVPEPAPQVLALLDRAAQTEAGLELRYAVLALGWTEAQAEAASARLKAPGNCRDLARMAAREQATIREGAPPTPAQAVELFDRCDAWRKPERFDALLAACEFDVAGETDEKREGEKQGARNIARLRRALCAAQSVNAGNVAKTHTDAGCQPPGIAQAVRAARIAAVAAAH